MFSYSFLYVSNNRTIATEVKALPGDLDALDFAEKKSERSEVIVWTGDRYVARVKKGGARPGLNEVPG